MKPDLDKIDDAVMALLWLTSFSQKSGSFRVTRAWKEHDWEAMNRLHEKGLIGDPKSKAKSIVLSDEGLRRSEELFKKLFCDEHTSH